ncbi:MAG: hypothetical protein U0U67_00890 [Chitinophagales bacterium]
MSKLLSIILLLFFSLNCSGQIDTLFYVRHHYESKYMVRKDSTGYYFLTSDTSVLICFPYYTDKSRVYKFFDRKYNLLGEGEIKGLQPIDYFVRKGKWTEYFSNKKIKTTGYYYNDRPIGNWNFYYPKGNLKETYTISLIEDDSSSNYCKTGLYQEYFENGQLKTEGFYKAAPGLGSIYVHDPETGIFSELIVKMPVSQKDGIWTYYKINGEIEKQIEFRDGNEIEIIKKR